MTKTYNLEIIKTKLVRINKTEVPDSYNRNELEHRLLCLCGFHHNGAIYNTPVVMLLRKFLQVQFQL